MVTFNEGWRGTRPLEWAKPGYWLPPVYLEANVWIEFANRFKAVLDAYDSEWMRPGSPLVNARSSENPADLLRGKADYVLLNRSSTKIPLPADSVDAVITDPPYGNYVHYGDLTNFWTSWLSKPLGMPEILDATEEAVPARKIGFPGWKSFTDYSRIMTLCFQECWRVLKPGGFLAMTFNNREPRAWVALVAAVAGSGFSLPSNGVHFQDGIASYKHTAQSRRAGSVIGDFVYSFRKGVELTPAKQNHPTAGNLGSFIEERLVEEMKSYLGRVESCRASELFQAAYLAIQPDLFHYISAQLRSGRSTSAQLISEAERISTFDSVRGAQLRRLFAYDGGLWKLRSCHETVDN
jgi:hypothetical protein